MLPAQVLVNPYRPEKRPGYVYIKPPGPLKKTPPDTIVVHEAYEAWGDGINVGYADGHVQFVSEEARFKKELARSKQAKN